jgi:hypothetical protein
MIAHWRLIAFLSKINERRPNPKSQTERQRERERATDSIFQQATHTATFHEENIPEDEFGSDRDTETSFLTYSLQRSRILDHKLYT